MEGLTITTETSHKLTPGLLHRCHCMLHARDLGVSSVFWFLLSWDLQANMLNTGIFVKVRFMVVWGDLGVPAKETAVDSVRLGSFRELASSCPSPTMGKFLDLYNF